MSARMMAGRTVRCSEIEGFLRPVLSITRPSNPAECRVFPIFSAEDCNGVSLSLPCRISSLIFRAAKTSSRHELRFFPCAMVRKWPRMCQDLCSSHDSASGVNGVRCSRTFSRNLFTLSTGASTHSPFIKRFLSSGAWSDPDNEIGGAYSIHASVLKNHEFL